MPGFARLKWHVSLRRRLEIGNSKRLVTGGFFYAHVEGVVRENEKRACAGVTHAWRASSIFSIKSTFFHLFLEAPFVAVSALTMAPAPRAPGAGASAARVSYKLANR